MYSKNDEGRNSPHGSMPDGVQDKCQTSDQRIRRTSAMLLFVICASESAEISESVSVSSYVVRERFLSKAERVRFLGNSIIRSDQCRHRQ